MSHDPPRLAVRLLTLRLSQEWCDFVIGDLEEEFHARAAVSVPAAHRWFWRQALHCIVAPPTPPAHNPRSAKGDPFMRTLVADFRRALGVFRRAPSFAASVVAVLALGVGANTAIFSIVNAVLLRPLPFPQPDRLVRLFHVPPQSAFPGIPLFSVSPANFLDWQRESTAFEGMAAYHFRQFTIAGNGNPEAVRAVEVGPGFFSIVGTQTALGRTFLPEEHAEGRSDVVVLSDAFWRSHFGGARSVMGRTLDVDGKAYTVIGVMPAHFSVTAWGATSVPMWVPLAWTGKERAIRDNHNYQAIARLRPDVDLARARSDLATISRRLEQAYPADNAGWGGTAIPLGELIVGDIRKSLLVLLAAVALVLLIGCANVANLILARSISRRKEIAIRVALGAGRRRVFQHLLAESLVLSLAGGLLGLGLAHTAVEAARSLLADQVPRADETSVDAHVLLFVLAASVLTGVLSGLVPALRAGRTDLNDALKEGGRSGSAGPGGLTRRVLIVVEVALSLMLLMGAGVTIRSLNALRAVDAGFNAHHILKMDIALPAARPPEQRRAFYDALLERVRALPGVESAGYVDKLPATGGGSVQALVPEGRAELSPREQPTVAVREAGAGYMKTMEIPILRGRDFASSDTAALLLSASAARLLWGDADPVGRRATLPLVSRTEKLEIVGIVGDVKETLQEKAPPTAYVFRKDIRWGDISVAMRTTSDPTSLAKAAVAAVHAIDPRQPVQKVLSMEDVIEETLVADRFRALLLEVFGAAALVLASMGIYSVLSYLVRGQQREIGIRTALGAGTAQVVRMVMIEGLKPTLLGIAIGCAGALAASRLLETLVFGVKASDPLTLAVVAGALLVVAASASLLPARHASRVDPLIVLRD